MFLMTLISAFIYAQVILMCERKLRILFSLVSIGLHVIPRIFAHIAELRRSF